MNDQVIIAIAAAIRANAEAITALISSVPHDMANEVIKLTESKKPKNVEKVQAVPVPAEPAPVPAPVMAAPVAPAPVAEVPTPVEQPVPVPHPEVTVPWKTPSELQEYCMQKYTVLGPTRGGLIQQSMIELGFKSLAEVKPENWGELYLKLESI